MSRRFAITAFGFLILIVMLAANYLTNFLGIAESAIFDGWQLNGQARVVGGILADEIDIDKQGAHLGKVALRTSAPIDWNDESTAPESIRLFDEHVSESIQFEHYRAQFGLQEIAYSFLNRTLGLDTLVRLQIVPAILTALVVVGLFFMYRRLYNGLFATLFLLSLACAPYFLSMARNVYWNPWLMLAPALAAAFLYRANSDRARLAWLGLVGILMMLKCLSNYEYLTSVTVLACSVFIVAPLFTDPKAKPDWKWAMAVFVICIAGFAAAFLIHASVRGDTILAGMRNIYVEDIARRTFGDPGLFVDETRESLQASVWDVLRIYFFEYPGRRTMIVPGKVFLGLFAVCLVGIAWRLATRHPLARRDAWMFVTFLAVPLSWFIAAKGHSYTQTHINFVLWYIGFMPALLFIAWKMLRELVRAAWNKCQSSGVATQQGPHSIARKKP